MAGHYFFVVSKDAQRLARALRREFAGVTFTVPKNFKDGMKETVVVNDRILAQMDDDLGDFPDITANAIQTFIDKFFVSDNGNKEVE